MQAPARTLALPAPGDTPPGPQRPLVRSGRRAATGYLARAGVLALLLMILVVAPARAEGIRVNSAHLEERTDADPGLFLDATFDFSLPAPLEDAINRGIALYFVVDFEMSQQRWYWFDRKLVVASLAYRLAYSPLTRQYRLARGSLAQPFDTLAEALATIRSVRSWKLAEPGLLQPGTEYTARLRMRLDTSLLPKPFQVSALTNRDWTLSSDWHPVTLPGEPAAR